MKKIKKIGLIIILILGTASIVKVLLEKYQSDEELKIGQEYVFTVDVPETNVAINAAQIDIRFDNTKLAIIKMEKNRQFFKNELQEEFNNDSGWARVSGGIASPGIKQKNIRMLIVYFQAKKAGRAWIEYSPTGLVLGNYEKADEVFKLNGKTWLNIE